MTGTTKWRVVFTNIYLRFKYLLKKASVFGCLIIKTQRRGRKLISNIHTALQNEFLLHVCNINCITMHKQHTLCSTLWSRPHSISQQPPGCQDIWCECACSQRMFSDYCDPLVFRSLGQLFYTGNIKI